MMKAIEISMYRISRLLTEQGWSQAELARKIGVTQQTVQQWVHGKASPKPASLDKLVEVTGHPAYWFMMPPDDNEQSSTPQMPMTNSQRELLQTFDAFPEDDQKKILKEMKDKKEEMEETIARWMKKRGRRA
ncbi:helix-turn-helix domain-containing protein [Morganella morganii]|uniref:helix-turn-helix domain-containing protein n=1 Tax=Morganella morganii TaxID=582 RepID=UPI003EB919C6